MEVDCCAHHNFARATGSRVPFVSETAGGGDLFGHHFFAMKKSGVAAREIGASILPPVCLNGITCS
jgi:hypothetical protein